jgi:Kef-type K+ transport system membrane component KefB
MIMIFLSLGIILIFFSDMLSIDPERFPKQFRIAFAVLLVVYAGIRFGRLINKKNNE